MSDHRGRAGALEYQPGVPDLLVWWVNCRLGVRVCFRNIRQCSKTVFLNRGPVPGPGIIYTGPREVFLEFVILIF